MMAEIIVSLLLGIMLGLKFTCLGLILASAPFLVFTLAGEMMTGSSFLWAAATAMCAFAALQVGYVCGALLARVEGIVKDFLAHSAAK